MIVVLHWYWLIVVAFAGACAVTVALPASGGARDWAPLIWFGVVLMLICASIGIVLGHYL